MCSWKLAFVQPVPRACNAKKMYVRVVPLSVCFSGSSSFKPKELVGLEVVPLGMCSLGGVVTVCTG